MAQLTIKNVFSQMINFALFGAVPTSPLTERMTIKENQHFALPNKFTSLRVRSGKAWISYLGKDIVLKTGETLEIEPGRDIAIITSLGYKPVEVEFNQ